MTPAVLAPFALALAAPAICRLAGRACGAFLASVPLALTVYFLTLAPAVAAGETHVSAWEWAPSLGLRLAFALDGLALLFALLICGVGTLVVLYAGGYLAGHASLGRFYFWLLFFMGSMLGLVLADNLILLFIFWELTSISSFFLIGFDSERASARAAALQALLVTGTGGLALLAGFLLMAQAGGTFELSELLARGDVLTAHRLYTPMLLLVLAGAFTKSAQVPFHFWLPGAMEAPTPVSAYLHSATMVKAGVYLLARVTPALGGTDAWTAIVTAAGAATLLIGSAMAITQTDLKRVLAYSTVGALGALTLLLGVGGPRASGAAAAFLLAHALYKGALFLVAGAVDHEAGTRDAGRLSGLRRAMPYTAAAAAMAAVAMMGVGPVLSFIAKEQLLEAVLETEASATLLTAVAVLGSGFFAAAALIVGIRPFAGAVVETPRHAHEAPRDMIAGPLVLASLGVLFGIWPVAVGRSLISPAAGAIAGERLNVELALWHGLTPALGLTALSLVIGIAGYFAWPRVRATPARLRMLRPLSPTGWYEAALRGLNAVAAWQTLLLQSGYLRAYLHVVLATTLVLVVAALYRGGSLYLPPRFDAQVHEVVVAGLMVAAAVAAVRSAARIAAVVSLGVAGVAVALSYVMFSAPDLGITQVLVETLTVILFALVFFRLPGFARLSSPLARARDVVIAVLGGALMTTLLLAVGQVPADRSLAEYFASRSVPDAHGRNVVNVILVDFRSLDTLGEITVLALAGIGVYALLRLRPAGGEGA